VDSRYVPAAADIDQFLAVQASRAGYDGTITSTATGAVLDAGSFASTADLASLGSARGGAGPQSLFVARLGSGIDVASDWGAVNTAVQSAKKYVLLDLSACAVSGGVIRGANATLQANSFNIIQSNPYIKSIILPDELEQIGNYTFLNCSSLVSITIPETVTDIGGSAFEGCASLTGMDIPDTVIALGPALFRHCARLERVSLPDDIGALPADLFYNCASLPGVDIPEGTTVIGNRAFYGCSGLTGISLPDTVSSIGAYAFQNTALAAITIPESVTAIGNDAFNGCTGLARVRIPGAVSSLANTAFQNCTRLEEVTFGARSAALALGINVFDKCYSLDRIVFEDANISWSGNAFPSGSTLLTAYTAGGAGVYELSGTQWYKQD
jgi:hypothetical protein